ncbi:alpha/beta hydrolase [Cruoricaptor ignavus]|uniref:Alpha/beta hydrolase n=1 Tax=Cruoricaptor ignavus TaxID=1118202 RepID=A0A7M1T1B6_9FLAO|nr:alpha/beta fold hydrolase [Cruoricaptor ignavus]QOR73638.1 alpha/beta hydrolase [Cruoricaptor ignavus]
MEELKIRSANGCMLSVHLFEPERARGRLLLINSATGVRQQVYFKFARFFAEKGYTVLTYDYEGIGNSKPENLKKCTASMRSWGTEDFASLLSFINEKYPDHRKFCLGHSVGALIMGMADSRMFEKFVFTATQDSWYRNLPNNVKPMALICFGLLVPLLTAFLGYFPAHRFGLGESLPAGSAMDWRTLILKQKSTFELYLKIGKNFAKSLTHETLMLSAEDDAWVTRAGMENLLKHVYPNLRPEWHQLKKSESPLNDIGHINFFRSYNKPLWEVPLRWLESSDSIR